MQFNAKERQCEKLEEKKPRAPFPFLSQNIQFKVEYLYRKCIKKSSAPFFLYVSNVVKHTNRTLQISISISAIPVKLKFYLHSRMHWQFRILILKYNYTEISIYE